MQNTITWHRMDTSPVIWLEARSTDGTPIGTISVRLATDNGYGPLHWQIYAVRLGATPAENVIRCFTEIAEAETWLREGDPHL